ncbi:hypothetical protein U1Q18_007048 [Sarracenia purpurea var. burkii]
MKFKDGYMISSGQPVNEYIDSSVRHVLLRHGVFGPSPVVDRRHLRRHRLSIEVGGTSVETVRRLKGATISSDLEGFGEAPVTGQRALGLLVSPNGRIGLKVASGAVDLADGAVGL